MFKEDYNGCRIATREDAEGWSVWVNKLFSNGRNQGYIIVEPKRDKIKEESVAIEKAKAWIDAQDFSEHARKHAKELKLRNRHSQ